MKTITTMRQLRETPVRDLTPEQCRKLLVHHHGGSLTAGRRAAYLYKGATDPRAYFSRFQIDCIKQWIERETITQP